MANIFDTNFDYTFNGKSSTELFYAPAVCAESVETKSQARFMRDAGCAYGQGFVFAEPLPPDEFLKTLIGQELLPAGESEDPWETWFNSDP